MKLKNNPQTSLSESGFTLIEVMISMLIFATGMLGVAYQMSQGIKTTINTKVHSSVMQVALQTIEPLSRAVLLDTADFSTALASLSSDGEFQAPFFYNSNQENFTVSLDTAKNIEDQSLIAADDANVAAANDANVAAANVIVIEWKPPYTIVLKITYPTTDIDNPLTFYTTHVIAPNS